MMKTIKDRVTIAPGGHIEIDHPELPTGAKADVIVMVENVPDLPPLASFVARARGALPTQTRSTPFSAPSATHGKPDGPRRTESLSRYNIFIYALEAVAPWSSVTIEVLTAVDEGRATGVTSELSLAECLVKPYQVHRTAVVQAYQDILTSRPHFTVAQISRDVLIEASKLRAGSRLRLPDAIHVATALKHGSEAFLTNDQGSAPFPASRCIG